MNPTVRERADELFAEQRKAQYSQTDRLFGLLMGFQYVAAVIWAALTAPLTWEGALSSIHPHLLGALILGGLIALPICFIAFRFPGRTFSRYAIAVGQMLMSALLIHISGGRIETHFHVFGSLAFLAFYRDWKVLIPATVVIAADHVVRGLYLPASVYGVASGAEWRFVEHACWVIFEDIFLVAAILKGVGEMKGIALRQALVEEANANMEAAKEEAVRANLAKSAFLSRMSHELRTPLNSILGFAQLMEMRSKSEREREEVSHILRGGRHLLQLINEVLEISRIESGNFTISVEVVCVRDVVEEALAIAQPLAEERGVKLGYDLADPTGSHVLADRQRLLQVFLNLVANAIKYNVRDGAVNVTAESAKDGRVRIAFSDTGIGIPEELKDRVFTPFDRLGTESTGEIEGTGLGLSLSKSLVEVMGGTIDFVSQLDLGSTFYVNMVAAEPLTLSSEVLTELNTIQGETGRMKIVYIEDNSPNIVLMRHVIATMPEWTLYVAETGRRGIELISEKMPDVVLLDLDLPDMGGAEVLRILRADEGLEGLRILVVSADATPSRINSLLASGADEYVSKPFDVKDLVTRIASCAKSGLPKAA